MEAGIGISKPAGLGPAPQEIGSAPIEGISVIPEVCDLVLPGDWLMRIDVRAILNLLFRQSHIQSFGLPIRHANNGDRRDQYLPAAKPAAGLHH